MDGILGGPIHDYDGKLSFWILPCPYDLNEMDQEDSLDGNHLNDTWNGRNNMSISKKFKVDEKGQGMDPSFD